LNPWSASTAEILAMTAPPKPLQALTPTPWALATACLLAAPASAQSSGASGAGAGSADTLEEIVVTAQKREEKLLDVPMSITAVTGRALEERGVTTLQEIASTIPGLSMLEYSPGQQRIQIRGISAATNSPVIGLYIDELPINLDSTQQGLDVRFLDLDRIEVLRGPQGTLYGEGSMGGTIKYVTRDPNLEQASFGFDSAFGSVADGSELYRGNFIANLPLIADRLGVRIVGGYERSPGWVDYPLAGGEDVNEGESTTLRVKGLWQATDRLIASLLLMYQDSSYDSQGFADADREAPYLIDQPYSDETTLASLVLEYDAGPLTVLSATGYVDRTSEAAFDVTGFFAPIYTFPPPFGFGLPPGSVRTVELRGDSEYEILTQEIRLASSGDAALEWTLGAYYRDYEESLASESETTPNPLAPLQVLDALLERSSRQFAAFGELTYAWTEQFGTTLGLRYFRDERDRRGFSANFGFPLPEPLDEETFTAVNPRVVFSYSPEDDRLFYASASKGFRSGGFNLVGSRPPGCNVPVDYEPEKLWTYELGSNLSFGEGRVVLQSAVYHNDWKDIQVSEFCPGSQLTQTSNVGAASGTGVDVQLTLRPTDTLDVVLSGGYTDSQYDDTSASHREGDQIDFVPEFTFGASIDWAFRWGSTLPGKLHVDYQHTDAFTIALRNFANPVNPDGISASDSLGRLNARLALEAGDWEIALFGQNLTDEDGAVMPPIGVLLVPVSPQPRTVGVGLRYNY
jgi:outer membrane receptor protein involved in Fe transport